MSLYKKYRPTTLDEVLGNKEQLTVLRNLLEKEERPQVYLLTGKQGLGKTTVARIAAKMLGANDLSTIEINSANNRGIDTAREIEKNIAYQTITPRVYILDELHQTNKIFQDAMLKTLEDTPKDNYFFLCTTNPEKLSKPFKSRCTQIMMQPLNDRDSYHLLKHVATGEGKEITENVIEEITDISEGHPRRALVLLEKVMDLPTEKDMLKCLSADNFETVKEAEIIELCRALYSNQWTEARKILKALKEAKEKPEGIRRTILSYFTTILLNNGGIKEATKMEYLKDALYDEGVAWPLLTMNCAAICLDI